RRVLFRSSNAVTKEGHKTISNIDASHTNDTECTLVLSGSSLTALFRSPRITPKPQYAANMCTKMEPPASTAPSRNSKRNHSKNIYDGTKRNTSVNTKVKKHKEEPHQEQIRRHKKDTNQQVRDSGNMAQEHAYGNHQSDRSKSTTDNHVDIDGITKYFSTCQDVQRK